MFKEGSWIFLNDQRRNPKNMNMAIRLGSGIIFLHQKHFLLHHPLWLKLMSGPLVIAWVRHRRVKRRGNIVIIQLHFGICRRWGTASRLNNNCCQFRSLGRGAVHFHLSQTALLRKIWFKRYQLKTAFYPNSFSLICWLHPEKVSEILCDRVKKRNSKIPFFNLNSLIITWILIPALG